jgi:hypothetical protein
MLMTVSFIWFAGGKKEPKSISTSTSMTSMDNQTVTEATTTPISMFEQDGE